MWPPLAHLHESRHAIVATAQGLTVTLCTVERYRGHKGHTSITVPATFAEGVPEEPLDPKHHGKVTALMRVALAGLLTMPDEHIAHLSEDADWLRFTELMSTLDLVDEEHELAFMARLRTQTHDLLGRFDGAIQALAAELTWRPTVPGDRVRAILAQHPPEPTPRKRWPKPRVDWNAILAELMHPYCDASSSVR